MTQYRIDTTLYASTNGTVTFPKGRTWADVKDWYVKWDTLYVAWTDGTEADLALDSETLEVIDWKRPTSVEVYALDDEGDQTDLVAEG